MSEDNSIFSKMNSKQSFIFGIVGGLLAICTIGFFVMLFMFLGGNNTAEVVDNNGSGNNQPSAQQGNNRQPSGQGNINLAEVTEEDWARGAEDPEITIVEFSDPECPFCKRFHGTMQQVMENYGDSVRWVYRHAPLQSLHQKAVEESIAMECAGKIGGNDAFWKFADRLYDITPSNDGLQRSQLPEIAEFAGVNKSEFQSCLDSREYESEVQKELAQSKDAGLRGTPHSIMIMPDGSKKAIKGAQPYNVVKSMIDAELN